MRARAKAVGIAFTHALVLASACGDPPDEPSSLQKRAGEQVPPQTSQNAAPAAAEPAPAEPAPSEPTPAEPSARTPADASKPTVELRLVLDGALQIDTVAMLEFPFVGKPTGYAIAEALRFRDCAGEGASKQCIATHEYVDFEAEPPAGRFLENDHQRVAKAKSEFRVHANGKVEKATVEGELEDADRALLETANHLWCIRLPDGPVAVGDTWTDTCSAFARGAIGTRDVTWTLASLGDDPVSGKRAELRYTGSYKQATKDGERVGTVRGILYFFVDHGQPHLMRETVSVPLGKSGAASTKAVLNVQFALADPSDPKARTRTDGQPFPPASTPTPPGGTVAPPAEAPPTDPHH